MTRKWRNNKRKGNRKSLLTTPKISPKKVGPLYLLSPLLITSGSELTLYTFPLLITFPHYFSNSHLCQQHVLLGGKSWHRLGGFGWVLLLQNSADLLHKPEKFDMWPVRMQSSEKFELERFPPSRSYTMATMFIHF